MPLPTTIDGDVLTITLEGARGALLYVER